MIAAPILALPNFSQPFVIECDASGMGIGAVLMQSNRPIAFLSRALKGKVVHMSTYEKELFALVTVIQKWRPYLLGKPFIVKTDHQSLKFLLEQKVGTSFSVEMVTKLIGYDFTVEYKKGVENRVADALSRRDDWEPEITISLLSIPTVSWLKDLKAEYETDVQLKTLLDQWGKGELDSKKFFLRDELLFYKGRIYIDSSQAIRAQVLKFVHSDPIAGHSGFEKTLQRAKRDFYWKGITTDLKKFIRECEVCQQSKYENISPVVLLQPLPILDRVWADVSMDFVKGLPISQGKSVILVVVDRLSKYGHFIALSHPYTAIKIAQAFVQNIIRLHGMPTSIVSDKDLIFTSVFWKELFKLQGTTLKFSTSYHPQTDGQTETVNKCVETYLRCFVQEMPKQWLSWLSWAEYWYNTTWHASTKMTPFEAVYGIPPPRLLTYILGTTKLEAVDEVLRSTEQILSLLRSNLQQAQQRMKRYADLKRSEREFEVGQMVYLRLQPYRQQSVTTKRSLKLSPRFYGPFQIVRKVGKVAYELDLPVTARIHPVVHVSQLKLKLESMNSLLPKLPPVDVHRVFQSEPLKILARRCKKQGTRSITEILVQWVGQSVDDASWEELFALQ
jgi:ribosomal protein L21E